MHSPQRDQRRGGGRGESPMTGSPPLGPGFMTGTKHQLVLGHGPAPAPEDTTAHLGPEPGTASPVHGASGVARDAGVLWKVATRSTSPLACGTRASIP